MQNSFHCLWNILVIFFLNICIQAYAGQQQPVYKDVPYLQDYAIKFDVDGTVGKLQKVYTDRNGVIQILSSNGLYWPVNGHFQYPGQIKPDRRYEPMADKHISDMLVYKNQFVYLDKEAVLSNAWAGKLFSRHRIANPEKFCAGSDFDFLIAAQDSLFYVKDSKRLWGEQLNVHPVVDIKYKKSSNVFFILTSNEILAFMPKEKLLTSFYRGDDFTCMALGKDTSSVFVGTGDGYFVLDDKGKVKQPLDKKLPWPQLSCISEIDGKLWFGSSRGAFMVREDGKFNYYFGLRWLPGKLVKHISPGPENSVLILTDKGLGQICFEEMTLEEKAMIFEKQVRQRQIRYGINSQRSRLSNHDLSTAQNPVADSDNLWTSMYLGSQLFRYRVTGSQEAKQNYYEAFEALERFHQINGIPGLFGRSFDRRGYHEFRQEFRDYVDHYWYEGYQGTVSWRHADDPEWDWRASASSDQTVGQFFTLTLMAEYCDEEPWRARAVKLLDELMTYIVENDLCLIDYNGKPSLWGRWHPQYVNRFDAMIGDRKLYSSNIIAFLQVAYHFTGNRLFKNKANELIERHGYLENLMRSFEKIGRAPADADDWSKLLSEEWNHSDDEMYFLAYWSLYPYAFNDGLKEKYREAIRDHWQWERPEKNPLWNFCYAMTGAKDFDLAESVWHLKEFPMDLIEFESMNSHRKDLEFVEKNFWGQTTKEVLPPDERPHVKHNHNFFDLDGGDRNSELSAGDTFLLPYWMGRFLGVISAPEK